jgi:hypothetical protein
VQARRGKIGDPGEDLGEPSLGIDVVEATGRDHRQHDGGTVGATLAVSKVRAAVGAGTTLARCRSARPWTVSSVASEGAAAPAFAKADSACAQKRSVVGLETKSIIGLGFQYRLCHRRVTMQYIRHKGAALQNKAAQHCRVATTSVSARRALGPKATRVWVSPMRTISGGR